MILLYPSLFVYTDIVKPNLVGESYVKLLRTLHFPSSQEYHRFDYHVYRPIEQSFIEPITIHLVTTKGEDVLFNDSDIPSVVTLYFKKNFSQKCVSLPVTMIRYTRYYVNQSCGGEIGPVKRQVSGCKGVMV